MVMKLQIFRTKKSPKVDSGHTCLAVISLDSTVKKDDNCYSQKFLKNVNTLREKQLDISMII